MEYKEIIASVLSVIAAIISFYYSNRARVNQGKINRGYSWELGQQYYEHLTSWSDECISLLSKAVHLGFYDPSHSSDLSNRRIELLVELSASIDRGRLFFPNEDSEKYGMYKEDAFKGYRSHVLDPLVDTYNLIKDYSNQDFNDNSNIINELTKEKRKFISEIHRMTNPKERKEKINRIESELTES